MFWGKSMRKERTEVERLIVSHLKKYTGYLTEKEEDRWLDLIRKLVEVYSRPELAPLPEIREEVEKIVLGFVRSSY